LLDFKLRKMARNNFIENGYIKPDGGPTQGLLSTAAIKAVA
jgi:hypothetical protein